MAPTVCGICLSSQSQASKSASLSQLWCFCGCFTVSGPLLRLLSATRQLRAGRRAISASRDATAAFASSGGKGHICGTHATPLPHCPPPFGERWCRGLSQAALCLSPSPLLEVPALSRVSSSPWQGLPSYVQPPEWQGQSSHAGKAPRFSTAPSSS